MITRTPKNDAFARSILNEDKAVIGKISISFDYIEAVDDGVDESGAVRYIADPVSRENEIYVVRVEVRETPDAPLTVQSEITYTGPALENIVELYDRLHKSI